MWSNASEVAPHPSDARVRVCRTFVLVGLWLPAIINLSGVKNMGSVQMVTTVLKFAALLFVSIVGLFYIKTANFTPWNVSGQGAVSAIGAKLFTGSNGSS